MEGKVIEEAEVLPEADFHTPKGNKVSDAGKKAKSGVSRALIENRTATDDEDDEDDEVTEVAAEKEPQEGSDMEEIIPSGKNMIPSTNFNE
jgi:hypothetical protein